MTGIDRLREMANDYAENSWSEAGRSRGRLMLDIADQIERERACDADAIENVRLIVGGVIDDMERHVSGVEGAEDSPVAHWARELREALKSDASDGRDAQKPSWHDHADAADVTSDAAKVTRDPAEDVSMSAYDLLPADEREAIAWVREHGGLSHVKDIYHDLRAVVERLGIEWSESELHVLMDTLDRRLMPEGCEWPRYESGEPVGFGDEVGRLGEVFSISLYRDGSFALNFRAYSKGERVRRPAVPASDGEPLEVGQTVWDANGDELVIVAIEDGGHTVTCRYADVGDGIPVHGMWSPSDLTHQRPVLDADGVPIKKGDTVYGTVEGGPFIVTEVSGKGSVFVDAFPDTGMHGSMLTHAKPEPPDSWERWRSDLESDALGYAQDAYHGLETSIDFDGFVRRARALAERERGE